ncbi:MAG: hypothetical protein A2V98_10620 [Planctomycetes bacterium RBG_16_64_12]|nr:MAG: hypothetical protein A2V98_10620 [Planctomycetes bacterium RBG_16_64_12]
MFTRIDKWLILGALLVVCASGCRGPRHRKEGWAEEMASKTTYAAPESTGDYTLPAADQWVCPMHPRIIESKPGKCSICGMDLVRSDDVSRAEEPASGSGHSHGSGGGHDHSSGSGCSHCG